MHIPFTKDSRLFDMLTHLPPLPLVINYQSGDSGDDNMRILHAIQQRDRILSMALQARPSILHELIQPMDEPFPGLETLSILSTNKPEEHTNLTLAETFLAPNLRHLALRCIGLPTGLPLHASALSLVTLDLTDIQAPGYLSPEHLVVHVRLMHQLEELSIRYTIPVPRPRDEWELLRAPITSVTLPSLKRLKFRGIAAYLESLVARIRAPLLDNFSITLFNQLAFTLPYLSRFIIAKNDLGYCTSSIKFDHTAVSIAIRYPLRPNAGVYDLHVNCQPFDWQVDSAGQICGALLPVLSFAEVLALYFYEPAMPYKWQGEAQSRLWRDLLLPFSSVKELYIDPALSLDLGAALQPDDEGLGSFSVLLPELEELKIKLKVEEAKNAFAQFIDARRLSGHPVELSNLLVSPHFCINLVPQLPNIQSEQIGERVFTRRGLADRRHHFQAPQCDPRRDNEEWALLSYFVFSAETSIRLVNLGDQVLGLAITDLIRDQYPYLCVGPSSVR
jgi:hypothetical protein